jgi:ubiquitin-conjugating enzyme E2 J2
MAHQHPKQNQKSNQNDIGTRRLTRELLALRRDPIKSPRILTSPLETNILEWHYVIEGSPGTPYEGGYYHGKLLFPKDYPLKPPSVIMCTPSGRFVTDRRLCLSMSDFHPESWNPMWSVSTILTGLYSFMIETAPTAGSIETTTLQKRKFAVQSLEYNVRDKVFCQLFPDLVTLYQEQQRIRMNNSNNRHAVDHPLPQSHHDPLLLPAARTGLNNVRRPGDFNSVLAATAGLVALVSIVMAMWSYFL